MTSRETGIVVLFVLCVWCLFKTRREPFENVVTTSPSKGPHGLLEKAGAAGGWDHGKGAYLRYKNAQLAPLPPKTLAPIVYPTIYPQPTVAPIPTTPTEFPHLLGMDNDEAVA